MARIAVRKGMPSTTLDKAEFGRRLKQLFFDPVFDPLTAAIDEIVDAAWDAYDNGRKAPRTRPAGPGYADPTYELSVEWTAARDAVVQAERRQKSANSKSRVLLVNGSPRNDHSCPGEISKS